MRYEDYKVENMVFTTKENWTEEEMREFLDTCPECKDNAETVKALKKLQKAIEDGIIKLCMYHYINKTSIKAYVKNHPYLYYGSCNRYRDENSLYVILDGEKWEINNTYAINNLLKKMDDIVNRFEYIALKYKKKEKVYATEKKMTEYTVANKKQIIASRIASAWLDGLKLNIPTKVEKDDWLGSCDIPKYYVESSKRFSGWDFISHNEYDELTFYDQPITKEEAEKIISVIQEASRKVSLIIDRCQVELQEIRENHRKEN